ncbi:hypothetical protein ABKJ22_01740 [Mesomycoplasma hyopneumoniae]|uniref:hypothetical protein n=1 Tax=Mesomycoplasma hyopneumoniae TaxID=2099 RepID=UPI0032AEAB90
MKQYKFKYIKIAETKGLKIAILHFAEEFREICKNKSKSKNAHKESMLHIYMLIILIRNWKKSFIIMVWKSLISARGKNKSPCRPKRNIQLTIFLKLIVEFIKKITENVLRRYGIVTPQLFLRAQKKRKQELEQQQKQEQEKDKDKIEN